MVIGRNEGARLVACLDSLAPQAPRLVYVDSGSTDDSVAAARARGAQAVELDTAVPFTAARARNAGADALRADGLPDFIQFVDGDCAVEPGWIDAAAAALAADPGLGLVTGWRSEMHPEASVFNRMAEAEWHRPAGPIRTCGGDMMVRTTAFEQVGGFDPTVIAAEDDEFCLRLGKAGWRLERIPVPMTRHDMAMTSPVAFWRRAVRSGHGFAQMGDMHPPHLRRERLRSWFHGGLLPLAFFGGIVGLGGLEFVVLGAWLLLTLRTARNLARTGLGVAESLHQAAWLSFSKLPNLIGLLTYQLRRARGGAMRIIEYK
nr:glycosyltransferase family 2 protein [Wenxinia marina]